MDGAIMAANEKQSHVTSDEEARQIYWMRRKARHDLISGLNGARREGQRNKAVEIARNLLAKGMAHEFVREITGLDTETIRGLPDGGR